MGNAPDEVKAVADEVTGRYSQHQVASIPMGTTNVNHCPSDGDHTSQQRQHDGRAQDMLARIRRSTADRDQGFTLIELLVVIIIIGILAAIAIPVFLNQRKKAIDASLESDLHNAAVIVEAWAVDHPGGPVLLPDTWEGTSAPGSTYGVLNGLKVSPGTWIVIEPSIATAGGWCLFAYNLRASKAKDAGHYMVWRSLLGGLDTVLAPAGVGNCA